MHTARTDRSRTPRARWAIFVLIISTLVWALLGGEPAGAAKQGGPDLSARAWVLIDARTGDQLAGKAVDRQLPIASATKLMTAYLTLSELPLDRTVKAPPYDANPVESVVGLEAGEKISARDLLVAMMLPSANDAAFALANEISGSVPRFVRQMNRAAGELGLDDTSYANPIGLDDPLNGSSAGDLATLARELRQDRRFRRIVAKPEATLKSGAVRREVQTRNTLLLADGSVDGVKTGHTQAAGYVLVASAERRGVPLISAVLGTASESARDAESARLLDYGFGLYRPRQAVARGEVVGRVPVEGDDQDLDLEAARGERVVARKDQRLTLRLVTPSEVEGPIDAGERIGRGVLLVDGRRSGAVPVLAARAVATPTVFERAGVPVAFILVAGGSILILIALVVGARRGRSASGEPSARTPEERKRSHKRRASRRNEEGNGS